MSLYPQSFIDEIKEKVDIVELISEYTDLKKSGPNLYIGRCPNKDHNDSTPSFRVWVKEQSWACMSCHNGKKDKAFNNLGSDCIAFIQWIHKLKWREAVDFLAKKYNIPIPNDKDAKLYEKQKNLCNSYRYNLYANNNKGYQYLINRGLSDEDICYWGLGYDGRKITFPLLDKYLNVLGFTKRWINLKEGTNDKYRNSSTTSIFNKSMYLYGINTIDDDFPEIRITEGPLDVILAHKYGAKNVVATLGTSFTEDHAKIIKHYNKIPTFCFDGDEAGLKAIMKSVKILSKIGVYSKILLLPKGLDLADQSLLLKNDIEEYIQTNSITYGYFLIKEKLNEYQSKLIELNMKYYPQIISILQQVPSQEERNVLQSYMKSIMNNREE